MNMLFSFEHLRFALVVLLVLFTDVAFGQMEVGRAEVLEQGHEYTEQFYKGELGSILKKLSETMMEVIGGEEALGAFRQQVFDQFGAEVEVLDEQVSGLSGIDVYRRYARFEKSEQTILVEWSFTAETIEGFRIVPDPSTEAPSVYLEYQTKTPLRLPFDSEWFVFWGGRTVEQNYHAAFSDQHFAYDFVVARAGLTHQGDGKRNEDYYCFGLNILAPGDGVVRAAVDGVPDQTPGEMNAEQPFGNYVILEHGNSEFSFLVHLQQGSVVVQKGQEVKAGEVLGKCGNSGNSSEPHLHYHLQTTVVPSKGEGLPAQFQNYVADAVAVTRAEPVQGQVVRQP